MTDELIAVLVGAVHVTPAVHAATAIDRAQWSERRFCAFVVFVALVTNSALLVTAVRIRWTITPRLAGVEAATGQCVATEAVRTICGDQACDATVELWITAAKTGLGAVAFYSARITLATHTVQAARARRVRTAAACTTRTTRIGCSARIACSARRCARHAESRACTSGVRLPPSLAGPRHGNVERKTLVAGGRAKARVQRQARQRAGESRAARDFHGAAFNRRASLAAKPFG